MLESSLSRDAADQRKRNYELRFFFYFIVVPVFMVFATLMVEVGGDGGEVADLLKAFFSAEHAPMDCFTAA